MKVKKIVFLFSLVILSMSFVGGIENQIEPLSEADVKAMKAKLSSTKFPVDVGVLLREINLDPAYLTGRNYTYEKNGLRWTAVGRIHENWTVRYRLDKKGLRYLDFQILKYQARSEDLSKRVRDIGDSMRRLASQGEILKFVLSREFEDVVIMPKMVTERLSLCGADLLGGNISVLEKEIDGGGPSHTLIINGAKTGISIPLRFDPAFDSFHIVPGFQMINPGGEPQDGGGE